MLKKFLIIGLIASCATLSGGIGTVAALSVTGQVSLTNEEKTYRCSFYNYDGTLLYVTNVKPSYSAVYRGVTPKKEADLDYYYEFVGWDKELTTVLEDTSYIAQFAQKTRDYHIKFVNYNHNVLYEDTIQAGDDAFYPYEDPTRPSDGIYSYVFRGWDEPLNNIRADTTFVAQYEPVQVEMKVYFFDYDETLLYVDTVPYGGTASYKGPTLKGPEAEKGYHYTFTGWSSSLSGIKADTSVIALYDLEKDQYTVTYYNYDETVLYVDKVNYGDSSVYRGEEPTRPTDELYSYTFTGWDKDTSNIQEDTFVFAMYKEENPDFIVTFKNYDGTYIAETKVKVGQEAVYEGETPTHPEEDAYYYEFVGWDRDLTKVESTFDTYAVFAKIAKKFTVTFLDYDGSLLSEVKVGYEDNAEQFYDGEVPYKPEDETYTYEFIGWDEDVSCITNDMTVIAQYEPIPKKIPAGPDTEGTGGDNGDEGDPPPSPGGGGGGGMGKICSVVFRNYDSEKLDLDAVLVGKDAHYDSKLPLPTRKADKKYSNYVFYDWDKPITNVQRDFQTFAQYTIEDDLFTKYIVTFRNDNGELLFESVCNENDMPAYPENFTPTSSMGDGYIFVGWDRPIVKASQSYTVYAKYQPVPKGSGGGGPVGGGVGFPPEGDGDGDGTPVMTLDTNYRGLVYLRERSFANYLGENIWTDPKEFTSTTSDISALELASDRLNSAKARFPQFKMELVYEGYPANPCVPYYTVDKGLDYKGDISAVQNGAAVKEFTYKAAPMELTAQNVNLLNLYAYSSNEYSSLEEEYREYVYDNYLYLTDDYQTFFESFVEENNLSINSLEDIVKAKDFIKGYCKYNLKAASLYPDGVDQVKYFLTETREGICNHFGSSLTMLYRYFGIPARFTVGYLALSNGVKTAVQSTQAHAWTEVYIDGIGWLVIDGTGEGGGGGGSGGGGEGQEGEGKIPTEKELEDLVVADDGSLIHISDGSVVPNVFFQYNPFGKTNGEPLLTITVSAELTEKEYDGEQVTLSAEVEGTFLNEGDHIILNVCKGESDVGSYLARCRPRIYDKDGEDITELYQGLVAMECGKYKISKKTIEIETGSASKVYDGDPLTCSTYELVNGSTLLAGHSLIITMEGTQTNVGSSNNTVKTYKIVDYSGFDVTRNYRIVWHYGTLTVEGH